MLIGLNGYAGCSVPFLRATKYFLHRVTTIKIPSLPQELPFVWPNSFTMQIIVDILEF